MEKYRFYQVIISHSFILVNSHSKIFSLFYFRYYELYVQ